MHFNKYLEIVYCIDIIPQLAGSEKTCTSRICWANYFRPQVDTCITCFMLTTNDLVNSRKKEQFPLEGLFHFLFVFIIIMPFYLIFFRSDLWQGWLLVNECPHLNVFCGVPAVVMCSLSRQRLRHHLKTRAPVTKSISVCSLSSSKEISSKAGWKRFVRGEEVLYFTRDISVCSHLGDCSKFWGCSYVSMNQGCH